MTDPPDRCRRNTDGVLQAVISVGLAVPWQPLRTRPRHPRDHPEQPVPQRTIISSSITQETITLRQHKRLITETLCWDRLRLQTFQCNRPIRLQLSRPTRHSLQKPRNGDLPIYSTATWSLARDPTVRFVLRLEANQKDTPLVARASAKSLPASVSCSAMTPSTLPSYKKKSTF